MASIKTGPLGQLYTRFTSSPTEDVLHPEAVLHYVTSLTSVHKDKIISHLEREAVCYKKKEQKVLSCVESQNSCALEIATTIEFVHSGGAYLSGIDDNFVSDQTVTAPIMHFVNFEDGQIKQIRIYWDQGTFLKQVGVIGKTGRNWPIRDGTDQIKLIKTSYSSISESTDNPNKSHERNKSNTENLSLFQPKVVDVEAKKPAVIAPRDAARPPSRDLEDLVGNLNLSPEKNGTAAPMTPKAGAEKASKRTFALGQDIAEADSTPDRKYKSDPKKYDHFSMEDLSDDKAQLPSVLPPKRVSGKNKGTSWDFEDFVTPEKKPVRHRQQDERTFTWSDDEIPEPQVPRPKKLVPRKDAETHFELTDNSPEKQAAPINDDNFPRKATLSHFELYENSPIIDNKVAVKRQQALNDGINIAGDGMGGRKGAYKFNAFDEEDAPTQKQTPETARKTQILSDRSQEAKNMATHWSHTPPSSTKTGPTDGINIGGDGMGGKKGVYKHNIFDESSVPSNENIRSSKAPGKSNLSENDAANSTGGINIGGDGMGGKKGAYKHDIFAENSPIRSNTSNSSSNARGTQQTQNTGKSFWDF